MQRRRNVNFCLTMCGRDSNPYVHVRVDAATNRRLPIVSCDEPGPVRPLELVDDPSEPRLLRVGDLARASGKTVRAIHHYEELGLLEPDARSKGRFRLYHPAAVTRVRWISKLHELGLTLSQVQEIVSAWNAAPSAGHAMSEIRSIYEERLRDTQAQLERLHALELELEASVKYLGTCTPCDLDVVAQSSLASSAAPCKTCQAREHDRAGEPELVAGIHSTSGVKAQHAPRQRTPTHVTTPHVTTPTHVISAPIERETS